MQKHHFPLPTNNKALDEEGAVFSPRFNEHGLVSAVALCAETKDVLMLAHMNAEALSLTLETGDAWYYSRSRKKLWRKGEESGNIQKVQQIYVDCDQDALILYVKQTGPACHTNRKSCFYREVIKSADGGLSLHIAQSPESCTHDHADHHKAKPPEDVKAH